jgi:uncharacterized membrane protein YjjP (DUF1212 family)
MSTAGSTTAKADAGEVRALLCELSQLLLKWSWEGVVGYEEITERVGRTYGYGDTTVMMQAQSGTIELDGQTVFVKGGIPGFPPMAYTQDLKCLLADIYADKLSVSEARQAVKELGDREPPYPPFLVWLGVVIISIGFAVDIVGTWEGLLWAGITGTATGLVFVAADRVPGFGKVAQLVATLASGMIVMIAYKFGWTTAMPGLLLIASTFVFIPGDSISTQSFELAEGRWSAGVDRLFYSIIMLVLMVVGAMLAAAFTGSAWDELFPSGPHDAFPWWAAYPGRFVLAIGILLAFHMSTKHFIPALVTLWIVTSVAQVTSMAYGELAGTFVASVVAVILALWQSRKPRSIPAFVLMIPVIFALSPGSHGLRQLETWVSGVKITGVNDLQTLVGTLLAIGMGMVVGRAIAHRWRWITMRVDA